MSVTIYLLVVQKAGIASIIWGGLSGLSLSAIVGLFSIRRYIALKVSPGEIRKMLAYGLPFIPVNVMSFGLNAGTRMIIQASLGSASVGLYALGTRLGRLVQVLLIQPFKQIAPASIFSAEKDEDADLFYARLATYYLMATCFFALIVSVSAGNLLRLMSREAFWPAATIVPIMASAAIVYGIRGLISVGLFLKRRTYWFPIAFALGAAISLGSMVFLVVRMGISGAAVAILIGNLAQCYIRYRAGQKHYRFRLEWIRLVKIVATSVLVYLGVDRLLTGLQPLPGLILGILLSASLYVLLLAGTRFFRKGEVSYLRSTVVKMKDRFRNRILSRDRTDHIDP
jgi:O-antigen/teichoic acid export membrane protein